MLFIRVKFSQRAQFRDTPYKCHLYFFKGSLMDVGITCSVIGKLKGKMLSHDEMQPFALKSHYLSVQDTNANYFNTYKTLL